MTKYFRTKINFTLSMILILTFIIITGLNYSSYSKLIKEDIENISKLTSTNIYAEIKNEITKPIFVGLTMANNSFVIDWSNDENKTDRDIIVYLNGIKNKYNYDTAFFVSESSGKYYTHDGINKIINENDEHDIWYFDFIANPKLYTLDVDNDEANNNELTIFVNCKVLDNNNNILGVIGVGLKMDRVQQLLVEFSDKYDLNPYMIDDNGIIQVHINSSFIENENIFKENNLLILRDQIIADNINLQSFQIKEKRINNYVISKYIEEFDWYLIVEKDTALLRESFRNQIFRDLVILIFTYALVLILINFIIKAFKDRLFYIANTDHLTKIYNRRMFDKKLDESYELASNNNESFSLALFDIDNFKYINDFYGHIFADEILLLIAQRTKEFLQPDKDCIYRTGGDEFCILFYGNDNDIMKRIKQFYKLIKENDEIKESNITISMGIVHYCNDITQPIEMMKRADIALYKVKNSEKNDYNVWT